MNARAGKLVEKLSRGVSKSLEIFRSIETEHWDQPIFEAADSWTLKDLVAHFIYSEENLYAIARDIAKGGEGFPPGIDIDTFNQEEMSKFRGLSADELLDRLSEVRQTTVEWVRGLEELELDRVGSHPVLGESNVETVIFSIYAHQLLHMRETAPKLRK